MNGHFFYFTFWIGGNSGQSRGMHRGKYDSRIEPRAAVQSTRTVGNPIELKHRIDCLDILVASSLVGQKLEKSGRSCLNCGAMRVAQSDGRRRRCWQVARLLFGKHQTMACSVNALAARRKRQFCVDDDDYIIHGADRETRPSRHRVLNKQGAQLGGKRRERFLFATIVSSGNPRMRRRTWKEKQKCLKIPFLRSLKGNTAGAQFRPAFDVFISTSRSRYQVEGMRQSALDAKENRPNHSMQIYPILENLLYFDWMEIV